MGYYEYQAEIIRWIDGDTVELEVDLGFNMKMKDSTTGVFMGSNLGNKSSRS